MERTRSITYKQNIKTKQNAKLTNFSGLLEKICVGQIPKRRLRAFPCRLGETRSQEKWRNPKKTLYTLIYLRVQEVSFSHTLQYIVWIVTSFTIFEHLIEGIGRFSKNRSATD